ncbi:oxidoreductase [Epidermidibacterium keratini]|uniref:Oxidoreductase n=1 Tax=Epidermidibacterium keratini TaxID=1891644 RepID=A0A7L4YL41_9ACTN|nr:NAD(P)H-dependent oxidoreductase [Epidermidibacterium keratini]QHB99771.1 oxidoreductase [Epidermidibacterium keratini]
MALIKIIVGSARPVRVGDQVAEAVAPLVAESSGAEVEIVDLRDLGLPLLNEPVMPALGNYALEHTKQWAKIIDDADGVVFVTPQYNGGYPGSLKNAIDYLYAEWSGKPAFVLSYGARGGGLAAAQLSAVLDFIGLELVHEPVEVTLARENYGEDGRLIDIDSDVTPIADQVRSAGIALGEALNAKVEATA